MDDRFLNRPALELVVTTSVVALDFTLALTTSLVALCYSNTRLNLIRTRPRPKDFHTISPAQSKIICFQPILTVKV